MYPTLLPSSQLSQSPWLSQISVCLNVFAAILVKLRQLHEYMCVHHGEVVASVSALVRYWESYPEASWSSCSLVQGTVQKSPQYFAWEKARGFAGK